MAARKGAAPPKKAKTKRKGAPIPTRGLNRMVMSMAGTSWLDAQVRGRREGKRRKDPGVSITADNERRSVRRLVEAGYLKIVSVGKFAGRKELNAALTGKGIDYMREHDPSTMGDYRGGAFEGFVVAKRKAAPGKTRKKKTDVYSAAGELRGVVLQESGGTWAARQKGASGWSEGFATRADAAKYVAGLGSTVADTPALRRRYGEAAAKKKKDDEDIARAIEQGRKLEAKLEREQAAKEKREYAAWEKKHGKAAEVAAKLERLTARVGDAGARLEREAKRVALEAEAALEKRRKRKPVQTTMFARQLSLFNGGLGRR